MQKFKIISDKTTTPGQDFPAGQACRLPARGAMGSAIVTIIL